MTERRRWTMPETIKLVDLVGENYSLLFQAIDNSKSRKMVDDKWMEITAAINALGSGKSLLTREKVERKWTDLKSTSKMVVMKYRKGQRRTGGGKNEAKEPSEIQWRLHNMVGESSTSGISGAEGCDTSAPPEVVTTANSQNVVAVVSTCTAAATAVVESTCRASVMSVQSPQPGPPASNDRPSPYLLKRPKKTPKQQQLEQNKELLQTEGELLNAVVGIRDELQQTNSALHGILYELKRLVDGITTQGEDQISGSSNQNLRLFYNS